MRIIFKHFLKFYLKFFAKLALFVHRPTVIAIAGSINKSFAKGIIKKTIEEKGISVRSNPNNFNTEIGLPLAILNLESGYNSFKKWLPIIKKVPFSIFKKFPKYLVLSLGTSDPGDIQYLLTIIKPFAVVITDINQRYIEGFQDMDNIQNEYKALVKKIDENGLLLLNNDNTRVRELKNYAKVKTLSFGLDKSSDYYVESYEKNFSGQKMIIVTPQNKRLTQSISRFGAHHLRNQLIAEIIRDYVILK